MIAESLPLQLDLVDELRLRRWARLHFTSVDQRNPRWHPVVLDEMRLKDEELESQASDSAGRRYVPIAPEVPDVHSSHPVTPPRFLASPNRVSEFHYT